MEWPNTSEGVRWRLDNAEELLRDTAAALRKNHYDHCSLPLSQCELCWALAAIETTMGVARA